MLVMLFRLLRLRLLFFFFLIVRHHGIALVFLVLVFLVLVLIGRSLWLKRKHSCEW
jgi:hypothetical protein